MIDIAKGRYWDLPWSLVSSCSRCSPGCQNCWSLAMEKRFHKGIEGKVVTHPERLEIPLKRKKPTVYATWNDWCRDLNGWLYSYYGLAYLEMKAWPSTEPIPEGIFFVPTYHFVNGQSVRGLPHACVGRNGIIVHDPHPSRAGLEIVESWGFLIKVRP